MTAQGYCCLHFLSSLKGRAITLHNGFPRTLVGGVSLPRLIVGTNWCLGYSHTSLAKDKFIKALQTRERVVEVLSIFLEYGIDAVMGPLSQHLDNAIREAEQGSDQPIVRIYTPSFDLSPDLAPHESAQSAFDQCAALGAIYCLPHQCVTEALLMPMSAG